MDREDFITKHWESEVRLPEMDAKPQPEHYRGHFDPQYEAVLKENRQTKESMYQEEVLHEQEKLRKAINNLSRTDDGYLVLRWLCKHLAFKDSVLAMVNGSVDTKAMLYNEARRIVWSDIRALLNISNRNNVEEDQ